MTQLFIRFYLGIIVVLFAAWLIQAYVFIGTTADANVSVVEGALSGGAYSARDDLVKGGEENFEETMAKVRSRFAYPVNIVQSTERALTPELKTRVDSGEAILYFDRMLVSIPDSTWFVELGPLPQFAGPSQANMLVGLGSVLILAAVGIAILLRPIARQFRTVEQTALAIADGDLGARIDERRHRRGLPLVAAFNTMAERVENLLRSQKELLQAVSHELRTPLARIKFATELVRSADSEAKRDIRLDGIDEATDSLNDLVGELLDYMRLGEEVESVSKSLVPLEPLINEMIDVYSPLNSNIKFRFHNESRDEICMLTHRAKLQRAIGNLISNAAKYAKAQVLVCVQIQTESILISVDDDGPGIPQADRNSVFEPFKRLAKAKPPGAGLGLSIVRRICSQLDGEVLIGTSPLGGARFTIKLNHRVS